MKILLLMFLISVIHARKPVPLLHDEQVHGIWYINAWMGNMDIPEDRKNQKIPPFTIVRLSNGRMEGRLNLRKNGRCEEIKLSLQKTKDPGKYLTWGKQTITVLDIFIENHIISYIETKMNGKNIIMVELLGRNPVMHPEALKAFKEFVQSRGFSIREIIIPEPEENCIPGRL